MLAFRLINIEHALLQLTTNTQVSHHNGFVCTKTLRDPAKTRQTGTKQWSFKTTERLERPEI
jgi:hypothetical protein